jgi:hypothetical protein
MHSGKHGLTISVYSCQTRQLKKIYLEYVVVAQECLQQIQLVPTQTVPVVTTEPGVGIFEWIEIS